MNTQVVVITNQKGGCGKTTIAMQLAGAMGREGKKVLVVDADPQQTALRWAAAAEDDKPFLAKIIGMAAVGGKIHREIMKFEGEYDIIVIDCPPNKDSLVPKSALLVARIAYIPVIPATVDLWAANGIQELIEEVKITNPALQAYILPNMCSNTNLAKGTIELLKKLNIKTTKTTLRLRTAYRESPLIGGTVFDLKGEGAEKAQTEVKALNNELLKILAQPIDVE